MYIDGLLLSDVVLDIYTRILFGICVSSAVLGTWQFGCK